MGLPRFHAESLSAGTLCLSDEEAAHAVRARRLSVGDAVTVFDGAGHEAVGRIVSISRSGVDLALDAIRQRARPLPILTLAVALPKGPRQDILIEKCTELGLAALVPLMTERTVSGASEHKLERWRRTAIEAAKQSGQAWIPQFYAPEPPGTAIRRIADHEEAYVAAMGGQRAAGFSPCGATIVFIGPEGGWTDGELDLLGRAGCQKLSLGPNTLRIETAAIVAAAFVHVLQRTE